jgi:hypothetical protein
MRYAGIAGLTRLPAALICGGLFTCTCYGQEGHSFHGMKADRILFLGNSITLHGVAEGIGWPHKCGMAASVPEKDYVHRLAAGLDALTGGHLRISPVETTEPGPDGVAVAEPANVLNVADIVERQYATYTNARLQAQLDYKPDIVVLQFGENTPREGFDPAALRTALETLMNGLRDSSNPQIFVLPQLLGAGGALDDAKREVCAEDPTHRVFVDMSGFGQDPTNFARAEPHYTGVIVGHPGDKGMARIAGAVLEAMVTHADRQDAPPAPAAAGGQ